jgi:hypothetical protein
MSYNDGYQECRRSEVEPLNARVVELEGACRGYRERLDSINTPEIQDFIVAVENEAKHQRIRWEASHDSGKTDADWFWLIGYLAGKALHKPEKQLHHIITTAAACLNWHAAKIGVSNSMRPGIADPDAERAVNKSSL